MLTLFQILFGDDWDVLMDDCEVKPPFCTKRFFDEVTGMEMSYGDCGSAFAPAYFISFIVICQFTMINLFVGACPHDPSDSTCELCLVCVQAERDCASC